MTHTDLLIIGGGAAGLMAAIAAARTGQRVIILERSAALGGKIPMSGGGRCNLSNAALRGRRVNYGAYYGAAKNFVKPALTAFDLSALADFFGAAGVKLYSPDEDHYYPFDNRAQTIVTALQSAASLPAITAHCNVEISALLPAPASAAPAPWTVRTSAGVFSAPKIILAAGGKAAAENHLPRGLSFAQSCGHTIIPPAPALAPLLITEPMPELAGVSLHNVELSLVSAPQRKFRGDFLFTHQGFSGPAVLNLSGAVAEEVAANGQSVIAVSFLPAWAPTQIAEWRRTAGRKTLSALIALPAAVVAMVLRRAKIPAARLLAELTAAESQRLTTTLTGAAFTITQAAEWKQAMVMRGGVSRTEVDGKTMQSRLQPGLFFAGEILDVDGVCGGFNLHWAFASGALAGRVRL